MLVCLIGDKFLLLAAGIFVRDILEAVPIDKFFDLFKPGGVILCGPCIALLYSFLGTCAGNLGSTCVGALGLQL